MGISKDALVKVGNFSVLNDFVIVDMVGKAYAHVILGKPFLATSGCKIDVNGGRLTFDVWTCHVEFTFFID